MAGIEAFLILAVAALHLAVVARRVGPDQLVTDAQLGGSFLEQRGQIALTVGEAVGKLETVVRLDALHFYAPAGVPRQFFLLCRYCIEDPLLCPCGRTTPAACAGSPPRNRCTGTGEAPDLQYSGAERP